MGAGSIGGYFGGMLARGGNDVTLVARGAHLNAIRRHGLRVATDHQQFLLPCPAQVQATDDPARVGSVDLVLLTVKAYHNATAIPAMRPLVGAGTAVLVLQNGVDSYQAVAQALGSQKVLPGAAYIEASLPQPGVVRQTGSVVRIVFGEVEAVPWAGGIPANPRADNRDSCRGRRIQQTLEGSGIPALFTTDIYQSLWSKFLFIATLAGVTSLSRQPLAELLPRPEWRRVVVACLREIEAVGRASGVGLDSQIVEQTLTYMEGSLEQMYASMHADLMAGRPLELEALNGAVVRAGARTGVPTPINDLIYAMLKPYAGGKPAE
jgi:2-dehydropantoate 2-reductase